MRLVDKSTVRNNILASLSNQLITQGINNPNVQKGSHFYAQADSVATLLTGLQTDIANDIDQVDINKAFGATLDSIGKTIKFADGTTLDRKPATKSLGYMQLSSLPNQNIFVDNTYQLTDQNGNVYNINQQGYYQNLQIIQIASAQTGTNTALPAGSVLKWRQTPVFANPTCTTFAVIAGGNAIEDDDTYRQRIISAKQNCPPGSALDVTNYFNNVTPYTDFVYCYPVFEGPGTASITATQSPAVSLNRSRQLSQSTLNILTQTAQTKVPGIAQWFIQPTSDNRVDIAFLIDTSSWVDNFAMPAAQPITSGVFQPITLVSVTPTQIVFTSPYDLTLFSNPSACAINISWISYWDYGIVNSQIVSYATTSGIAPFTITAKVNSPLSTANGSANAGDFIFPANNNTQNYLKTVLNSFAGLGPGEKYSSAGSFDTQITPRTARQPLVTKQMDSRITNSFLSDLMQQNTDITNVYTGVYILDTLRWASGINLGYGLGIIPLNTPPLSVLDMPGGIISSNTNIFTPQRIGFYPINGLST